MSAVEEQLAPGGPQLADVCELFGVPRDERGGFIVVLLPTELPREGEPWRVDIHTDAPGRSALSTVLCEIAAVVSA